MKSVLTLIFGTTVLFATITQAERKEFLSGLMKLSFTEAPMCEGRPEFITEVRPEIIGGFEKLPQLVLVANEAEYYVETKNSDNGLKIHSYQSFTATSPKEKSKIVCGSSKNAEAFRSSLFAPTLIDTTATKKVGQSLWQFQMLADKEGFSVWNKRSLAYSENESLEKALMKFGGRYRIYQLGKNQYEVVVSKDSADVTQYLSIKYDAVKSL
ncbi:hypothetical protein [Bdellovibrio sp. HCB337]|uniref:hypothetical protein n=1 Tax=Bdellovibrio sp. HCB337 TaxID=3394358 RepID=UPI0039A714DF